MFGGFGTVPNKGEMLSVWENIGTCESISRLGRGVKCDADKDGEYDDTCEVGHEGRGQIAGSFLSLERVPKGMLEV